jgi:hypothetical protein
MLGHLAYPLALFVSTLGLAGAAPVHAAEEPSGEMIVNGEPVTEGEIPFQVLITAQWTDQNGSWGFHLRRLADHSAMGADRRALPGA